MVCLHFALFIAKHPGLLTFGCFFNPSSLLISTLPPPSSIPESRLGFCSILVILLQRYFSFLIEIHSMQDWAATTKHGVQEKEQKKMESTI